MRTRILGVQLISFTKSFFKHMSTLANETLLETIYEEVMQEITETGDINMMNSDDIEFAVRQRFEGLS